MYALPGINFEKGECGDVRNGSDVDIKGVLMSDGRVRAEKVTLKKRWRRRQADRMMKLKARGAVLVLALMLAPAFSSPASAQTTVSDVVGFLVTNQAVPTDDIAGDRAAAEAARDTISRALLVNLTSAPLATSSSGFLYRLNPQLGTVERATESFGTIFRRTRADGRTGARLVRHVGHQRRLRRAGRAESS